MEEMKIRSGECTLVHLLIHLTVHCALLHAVPN